MQMFELPSIRGNDPRAGCELRRADIVQGKQTIPMNAYSLQRVKARFAHHPTRLCSQFRLG